MTTGSCRSCGAPIWWAMTPKGRRIPLNAPGDHPHPNLAVWRDDTGVLRASPTPPEGLTVTATTSHFATCPQADEHRRPR